MTHSLFWRVGHFVIKVVMVVKRQMRQQLANIQRRVVVWVVLTVVLQICQMILRWSFLEFVIGLAAIYCLILIGIWCYLAWQLYVKKPNKK